MLDIIDLLEYKIWQMKSLEDISHPVNLSMAPTNVAQSYSRHLQYINEQNRWIRYTISQMISISPCGNAL